MTYEIRHPSTCNQRFEDEGTALEWAKDQRKQKLLPWGAKLWYVKHVNHRSGYHHKEKVVCSLDTALAVGLEKAETFWFAATFRTSE